MQLRTATLGRSVSSCVRDNGSWLLTPTIVALTAGHAEAARCLLAAGDEPEPLLEALHRSGKEEQLPLSADVAARLPLTPAVGAAPCRRCWRALSAMPPCCWHT